MQSSKELKAIRQLAKLESKVEQLEEKFASLSERLTKLESKNPDRSSATQPEQHPVVTRSR
jgi:hypothetical protein